MRIRVDLLPVTPPSDPDVVVIVDVLRAATVASILFDRGLDTVALTSRFKLARHEAGARTLLLGEREGLPPEGFNYGNSPAELSQLDLGGVDAAVLVSDNAPAAVALAGRSPRVLLGSLYNADAAVRRALAYAPDEVALVCSGYQGEPDLDDALAAGLMAAQFKVLAPEAELVGAARFAISLLRAFPDPFEALWQSVAGHHLRRLELTKDLAIASQLSLSEQVPILVERTGSDAGELFRFRALGAEDEAP